MNDIIIRLQDVVFEYEGSDHPAVDHVNLDVKKGEVLAVLGRNGSGKSTLSRLLYALVMPSSGNIIVDGMQATEEALEHVQRVDTVLFGVNQTDAVINIIGQFLTILDADHIAMGAGNSLVNGIDQLLGFAGALQAHNHLNHRNYPPLLCRIWLYGHFSS